MENKITYENIRDALKCCWVQGMCKECHYNDSDDDIVECTSDLARDAMILLKSLKKDNDQLLKSLNLTQCEQYVNGRNDGIRGFADRLTQKAYPFPCAIGVEYAVTIRTINDLEKEMTEVQK